MELFIFVRFHAKPGMESKVEHAVRDVVGPSRLEAGCLSMQGFRSMSDPQLFYIHSRWVDEAAFDLHAALPHTEAFVELVETLVDHPLEVARTEVLD